MATTENASFQESFKQIVLGSAIKEFQTLIQENPRIFKDRHRYIILKPYYDGDPHDGFVTYIIEDPNLDVRKFLEDREKGTRSEGIYFNFDIVSVPPTSLFPIRRVEIVSERQVTLHLPGVEVPVRAYSNYVGRIHFANKYVIPDEDSAADYLIELKRQIEEDCTEISLD